MKLHATEVFVPYHRGECATVAYRRKRAVGHGCGIAVYEVEVIGGLDAPEQRIVDDDLERIPAHVRYRHARRRHQALDAAAEDSEAGGIAFGRMLEQQL